MNADTTEQPATPGATQGVQLMHSWRTFSAASAGFLAQLREFDLQRGYRQPMSATPGCGGGRRRRVGRQAESTAEWLHAICGLDEARVNEALRVAYKLLNLPCTEAAFAAGDLSYQKVRTLAAVATASQEAELVPFAIAMTEAQLAHYCERLKRRAGAGDAGAGAAGAPPGAGPEETAGG